MSPADQKTWLPICQVALHLQSHNKHLWTFPCYGGPEEPSAGGTAVGHEFFCGLSGPFAVLESSRRGASLALGTVLLTVPRKKEKGRISVPIKNDPEAQAARSAALPHGQPGECSGSSAHPSLPPGTPVPVPLRTDRTALPTALAAADQLRAGGTVVRQP